MPQLTFRKKKFSEMHGFAAAARPWAAGLSERRSKTGTQTAIPTTSNYTLNSANNPFVVNSGTTIGGTTAITGNTSGANWTLTNNGTVSGTTNGVGNDYYSFCGDVDPSAGAPDVVYEIVLPQDVTFSAKVTAAAGSSLLPVIDIRTDCATANYCSDYGTSTETFAPSAATFARFSNVFRPGAVTFSAPIAPEGEDWNAVLKLRDSVRAEILKHCGEPDLER